VTPWIRFDRGPNLPDQAVLLDLANRRFFFFWIEIWPHEFYFVAGLLIMAGSACSCSPRRWAGSGAAIPARRRSGPTSSSPSSAGSRATATRGFGCGARTGISEGAAAADEISRWLLIAVATGGAWVFYFADAPTLLRDLVTGQAAYVAYATIGILTATTFVFGGFMREQVCIYMCPWPRIQAAMMDEDTITVAYRDWRGEPRGKGKAATTWATASTATPA
jgi:polyferredoxin